MDAVFEGGTAFMMTMAAFFMLISAGSVLGAAVWGRRYEETLALTVGGGVLFLFLAGIVGFLEVGAYALMAGGGAAYAFSLIWALRKRRVKQTLSLLITPGAVLFALFYAVSIYISLNRLPGLLDEMSHWATVVKDMHMFDDMGTHSASRVVFKSYPPAMALLQYLVQKVYSLFGRGFAEWWLYPAYHLFAAAFIWPFLKGVSWKRLPAAALVVVAALCVPTALFPNFYRSLYIDAFLGVVSGCAWAMLMLVKEKKPMHRVYLLVAMAVLTLAKDMGLMLSLFLAIGVAADAGIFKGKKQAAVCGLVAFGSALLPKLLWSWHLDMRQAPRSFSAPIEWDVLLGVLAGRDDTYRVQTLANYGRAWMDWENLGSGLAGGMPFILSAALIAAALLAAAGLFVRQERGNGRRIGIACALQLLMVVVYALGLCVLYMFKFTELEAVQTICFERYINIALLSLAMTAVLLFGDRVLRKGVWGAPILLGAVLLFTPMEEMKKLVTRESLAFTQTQRSLCDASSAEICAHVPQDSRIFLIVQGKNGYDHGYLRYGLMPLETSEVWSLREETDQLMMGYADLSAEAWQQMLLEAYDYVYVKHATPFFEAEYGGVFAPGSEVARETLYRVNKETGLLERSLTTQAAAY